MLRLIREAVLLLLTIFKLIRVHTPFALKNKILILSNTCSLSVVVDADHFSVFFPNQDHPDCFLGLLGGCMCSVLLCQVALLCQSLSCLLLYTGLRCTWSVSLVGSIHFCFPLHLSPCAGCYKQSYLMFKADRLYVQVMFVRYTVVSVSVCGSR